MINVSEWIGLEIGAGRYKILERIGEGSMGQIFRAYDHHLETDVVLKFPVASEDTLEGADFLSRFEREIRSLVRLSHPHIVKVIDVGELERHPYVVMQYLRGGSLQGRFESGPGGEPQAMAPDSLRDWLLDVARALDFIHAQNHIHRDVKPANILFDEHGNAFLGDFGVIKALAADEQAWRASSDTAPGFLLGTPNYVAPEIVMGRPFDGRVDQYALAMTVHEVLTGTNCMSGGTPSATMVNQTMVVPPPLEELVPEIPQQLSDAIARGLSKDPEDRFESCTGTGPHETAGAAAVLGGLGGHRGWPGPRSVRREEVGPVSGLPEPVADRSRARGRAGPLCPLPVGRPGRAFLEHAGSEEAPRSRDHGDRVPDGVHRDVASRFVLVGAVRSRPGDPGGHDRIGAWRPPARASRRKAGGLPGPSPPPPVRRSGSRSTSPTAPRRISG